MISSRLPIFALIALALGAARAVAAADHIDLANLAHARYVHCAFYRHYDTDPETGGPIMIEGKADALMHFQAVDAKHQKAQAIYTRMAGMRNVTVIETAKAIHFIDDVSGMYIVTTVDSCLDYDEKRGICVTYGAASARVFDPDVLSDPDKVYAKIKDDAEPGFCDQSFIGIQEAAHDTR